MKSSLLLLFCLFLMQGGLHAQGENNVWSYSSRTWHGGNGVVDFNSPVPVADSLTFKHNYFTTSVCYPNGQLRFLVSFTLQPFLSPGPKIFHPDGTPVPDSDLDWGLVATAEYFPIVIPHPGNSDQYYIFYIHTNGLVYSLLDMSLNNGSGGIVPGQKGVRLTSLGSVYPATMASVQGCNGVWLVIKSRIENEYFSYCVMQSGLDTNKVISEGGVLPSNVLCSYELGRMKSSPHGNYLVFTSVTKGIELYDFEKCSGKVKNARIIDSSNMNSCPLRWDTALTRFRSACFSPDETKLYYTREYWVDTSVYNPNSGLFDSVWYMPGRLFQFDLSQPTLPLIVASKTLLLVNQPSIKDDLFGCVNLYNNGLGDMKLAPNGKIYFDNGSYTCTPPPLPTSLNPAGFHVINQPDLAGAACQVELNVIVPEPSYGIGYSHDFDDFGSFLPPDIVVAPPRPDTTVGHLYSPVGCFKDSMLLLGDTTGGCYLWDDGSTGKHRMVYASGTYFVSYFKECSYTTDTFHTSLVRLPTILPNAQSCPGMNMGRLIATLNERDSTPLNYIWKTSDGSIIRQYTGSHGDTISGLDTGRYFLQMTTSSGCDTTITAEITALPKPDVIVGPADTTIRYGDSITLQSSGALMFVWMPSGPLDSATKANPTARPLEPTRFMVIGLNRFGCMDTGYVHIDIDYTMPDFVPNAFSPNGDGLNDVFSIANITYQKVVQFRIFNRYGQQIFSTQDGQRGWDGSQNGKPCDMETYFYLIQLDYPNGKRKTYKGDVSLLR